MLQTLHAAWSGRRVLLLDDRGKMTRFLHALLTHLGARPARLPLGAGSEALARALTDGRVCCLIVPSLRALSGGLSDQLHALDIILMEAREAGVPLAMLLSDENVYRAAHRPWLVREEDPIGGETRAGLVHALLQLFADGVSRGLLGDPVHVLCVRHMPCLGCAHPAVSAYDRWYQALAQGEPLCVPQPDAQGVFLHPLDVCAGSLLLGARFLLGDVGCTGPFNLAVSGENCMPNRTAALRLCRRIGCTRPLWETEPSPPHPLMLIDGSRARRLCGAYPRIAADEALFQLWALSCAAKEGESALDQAISAQAEAYLSAL